MHGYFGQLIQSGGFLAVAGAFLGGLLTALNPCVLATVPLIVGFVGGQRETNALKSFLYSLVFVFGFCVELALLFTVMAGLAPYLKGPWMSYIVAFICIVMGLFFLDAFKLPPVLTQDKLPKTTGYIGALVFGFMYGLISLPCTGPALVLILSLIPAEGAFFGGTLLLFYGLGNCSLLLVAGSSAGAVRAFIDSKGAGKAVSLVKKIAAILIIIAGLYILYKA